MDTADFIPLLGKTAGDPALQAFLQRPGATAAPRLKSGDTDARVQLTDLGIDVMSSPEGASPGQLHLSDVMSDGNTEGGKSTPCSGKLPLDLSYTGTQDEVHRKAGRPSFSSDGFASDAWDFPACSYGNVENRPLRIAWAAKGYMQ